ncbi:LysM peptidoglycan-binding domain-containing protein [Nocardioides insulae]|uniref:LysM peptidoglycan-binding domain-containing protein n=1 Tax=Nocardioides insulae TaxID=394734 RepID=UPI00048D8790|nr:LysM peptidoglycan-binding domain-containing protein [Nocardioides insulae]
MSIASHAPTSARLAPRGSVRLTRRGRLTVFIAALVAAVGLGFTLTPDSSATQEAEQTETVLVGTGDTLWHIAGRIAEPGGTGAMVDHLIELNDLDSAMLIAGQELEVPAA